jgi:hypothetical protein
MITRRARHACDIVGVSRPFAAKSPERYRHRTIDHQIGAKDRCTASRRATERELGQVIAMALTINAWNHIGVIGVTTHLPLPKR